MHVLHLELANEMFVFSIFFSYQHSIMDVRVPLFTEDSSQIVMQSYLDVFPFPYYVIVRDLGQLPMVLSDAMRQWFELVNSEQ